MKERELLIALLTAMGITDPIKYINEVATVELVTKLGIYYRDGLAFSVKMNNNKK